MSIGNLSGDLAQAKEYRAGLDYLQRMGKFVPEPQMLDVMENLRDRVSICTWIGTEIDTVNRLLLSLVTACHDCFHPGDRQPIQIFALPLADRVRLDGFCNLTASPTTILVDVGRVDRTDWLALVAHEYAHAHVGSPGHHQEFAGVLSHLCLGLGLAQPLPRERDNLHSWPPYIPVADPLAWWRGEISGISSVRAQHS